MKKGKKVISILAAFMLILSISACSSKVVKPEEAFKNLSTATQGKMAIQVKMSGTGAVKESADVALNYVFGVSKDSKKIGISLAAQANIVQASDKPMTLDGRMNLALDISTPATPVLNFEAGASGDTIGQLGAGVTGPMVITANLDDIKKLSGVSEAEFKAQLDQFSKAVLAASNSSGTSDKSKEIVSQILTKVTEAVDKAEIKSTENGDKTVKVGSEEFSGKEYEYTITPDNMKAIMNSLADSAPEIITMLKTLGTSSGTDKDAALKQLDSLVVNASDITEAKKSINKLDIKDNVSLKVLIGTDGMPACITLTSTAPIDGEKVDFGITIGMKDLKASEDGMAYYTENKVEMYKGATIIPIGNFTGMLNK
jgi:hypothetical protein